MLQHYLVELDVDEDRNTVHKCGVVLEADRGGADVVGGGHEALHGHGGYHGIVDTCEERNPMFHCQLLSLSKRRFIV